MLCRCLAFMCVAVEQFGNGCWHFVLLPVYDPKWTALFGLPAPLLATPSTIWLSQLLGARLWCKYHHTALFPNLPHSSKRHCVRISNGYLWRQGEKEGWSYWVLPAQPLRCFAHLCKGAFRFCCSFSAKNLDSWLQNGLMLHTHLLSHWSLSAAFTNRSDWQIECGSIMHPKNLWLAEFCSVTKITVCDWLSCCFHVFNCIQRKMGTRRIMSLSQTLALTAD